MFTTKPRMSGEEPAICRVTRHYRRALEERAFAFTPPPCGGVTHRSRDVRARASLAVGPGRCAASDFLLLAQQLPVLLLPVLHVDEQRDEAVLHLKCDIHE